MGREACRVDPLGCRFEPSAGEEPGGPATSQWLQFHVLVAEYDCGALRPLPTLPTLLASGRTPGHRGRFGSGSIDYAASRSILARTFLNASAFSTSRSCSWTSTSRRRTDCLRGEDSPHKAPLLALAQAPNGHRGRPGAEFQPRRRVCTRPRLPRIPSERAKSTPQTYPSPGRGGPAQHQGLGPQQAAAAGLAAGGAWWGAPPAPAPPCAGERSAPARRGSGSGSCAAAPPAPPASPAAPQGSTGSTPPRSGTSASAGSGCPARAPRSAPPGGTHPAPG